MALSEAKCRLNKEIGSENGRSDCNFHFALLDLLSAKCCFNIMHFRSFTLYKLSLSLCPRYYIDCWESTQFSRWYHKPHGERWVKLILLYSRTSVFTTLQSWPVLFFFHHLSGHACTEILDTAAKVPSWSPTFAISAYFKFGGGVGGGEGGVALPHAVCIGMCGP